ncbi:MAG: thioredoxin domain-containing protein [Clostridiales bacterium]|jgi:uncharacterized protein YyaL (SSP411 family)|nr:thioredoxin domain-containing protein [Clostridiales bacterium]
MERESFEDQEVADILNKHFISIKVDREERPDIDHIYMTVCQALTGHGGWPLTIIMTPEQKPFFAGTYFPKRGRMGMPGLMEILTRVAEAWKSNKRELIESSDKVVKAIERESAMEAKKRDITKEDISTAYEMLSDSFDPIYGGFSHAPKFPTPHNMYFLLRYWKLKGEKRALDMVEKTLDALYRGGIFDHIGYGFSRYSTDERWLVPHFEKMLYDNALLAVAYLEAYLCTKKEIYANVARKIFTYVLRDMTPPEGGFYSAEDADSEGEEGKFYLWTQDEITEILGETDGRTFCDYYGISAQGNFKGKNIPNRLHTQADADEYESEIAPLRQRVFNYREGRIRPYRDDKILTSWNGLMIAAMAMGGRILQEPKYTQAAKKAVEFIFSRLVDKNGRLLARYRDGESAYPAYLDDYAYLIWGLIELYETTYKPLYLNYALKKSREMIDLFWDADKHGFFLYGKDGEQLITRPKEVYDGAMPSGNSVAAMNLLRLARLTGDRKIETKAYEQLRAFAGIVTRYPAAYTYFVVAAMFALYPVKEIVFAGSRESDDTKEMLQILNSTFAPQMVSLLYSEDQEGKKLAEMVPYIKYQKPVDGRTTVYVCENFTCKAPIIDKQEFARILS